MWHRSLRYRGGRYVKWAMLNGLTEDNVTVKLLGGDLQIQWDREANVVNMTGPAVIVFEGSFILP